MNNGPYTFDEELAKEIADYFTGPYEREVTIPCEGCGKLCTVIDKMPAGHTRIGILHGYCPDCTRKIWERMEEEHS